MSGSEGQHLETVSEENGPDLELSEARLVVNETQSVTSSEQSKEKQHHTVVVTIPTALATNEASILNVEKEDGVIGLDKSVSFCLDQTETGGDYIKTPVEDRDSEKKNKNVIKEKNKKNADSVYGGFSRSSTDISIKCDKKKTRKPKQTAFSKKDLEVFLPRKSFYNSHDNVLVEAGKQVDTLKERKKPDWRSILRMHTMEELYPVDPQPEEEHTPSTAFFEESDDDDLAGLDNVETAMSVDGQTMPAKPRRKAKTKAVTAELEEYKQLYDYLKYINEHPDEYISMTKYSPKNSDYRHPNNLVRMGRLYRRYNSGTFKNSMLLHAVNSLRTAMSETTPQRTSRTTGNKGEKTNYENTETQVEESEIEKIRSKTEKWMRTLTTHQVMRARELALKDVGEEDVNMSKWWLAFKTCKYLRVSSLQTPHSDVEA